MIEPNHQCWWSSERQTRLALSGELLTMAGTSLPVIMAAFREAPWLWYTRAYGDVYNGAHENLILVAVSAEDGAALGAAYWEPETGPLNAGLARHGYVLPERFLSDGVCDALGLAGEDADFAPVSGDAVPAPIRCIVNLHDDCFAGVEPVTGGDGMNALLSGVFALHNFYLGREIDWSTVLPAVRSLLARHAALTVASHPEEPKVTFTAHQDESSRGPVVAEVRVRDGVAVLEPR